MTNDANRRRFEQLLEAKKQGRNPPAPGTRPDDKGVRPPPPRAVRTFRRKV